jgi:hypothetical protein
VEHDRERSSGGSNGEGVVPKHGTGDVHGRLLRWVKDNAKFLRVDSDGTIHGYIPEKGSEAVPVEVSFGAGIAVTFCSG